MATAARFYSPTEAAVLSGIGVKAVNNAIDKRIVFAVRQPKLAGAKPLMRALSTDDLLRLKLWYEVGGVLSQERRERLFAAILQKPEAKQVRADDLLIIDVAEARKQIAARAQELEEAEAVVAQDKAVMGGEPVFKGTRIPVRLIATMIADGVDADEILAGYPKLDRRLVSLASIWATAHPRRGRPKSLKERGVIPTSSKRVPLKLASAKSVADAAR